MLCNYEPARSRTRVGLSWTRFSHRLHPIMADAPFAAVGIAEQARSSEQEPAPAPHPQRRIVAVDGAKNAFDLVAVAVEVVEPVERGALIVHAAPAPFLLDREQIVILP